MFNQLSLLTVSGLAAVASAEGFAKVTNQCDFEVTLWSVGKDVSNGHTLRQGDAYQEPFAVDPKTGGRTLKVTRDRDGLYTGRPQTNFAYSLQQTNIWYDLSDVFGDSFAGKKLRLASDDADCPAIEWDNGTSPGGSQTHICHSDVSVVLILCA
ncbi:BYS1 domain-containing protein [Cordyceps fumosorosea ARSEF 2679]|uniref:BYS1 domain-containing protein n=1 Tax=Cordyceps fumosorosea (strain ARSEF 2679) TaxID=1081104 RepID=A0A167ZD48_CORFA|nr:BYS1 domain-containing protein [Cordyceps fumosorosea ARSEF 2679]OAA67366.1 BYS1 domain-containing protein [Cordyceps fumosorosea ARSEF 2679]